MLLFPSPPRTFLIAINVRIDIKINRSVELELDEEAPEIPDETGQQIEIHEKQAKLEVTFAKSKSDKQNSSKCLRDSWLT